MKRRQIAEWEKSVDRGYLDAEKLCVEFKELSHSRIDNVALTADRDGNLIAEQKPRPIRPGDIDVLMRYVATMADHGNPVERVEINGFGYQNRRHVEYLVDLLEQVHDVDVMVNDAIGYLFSSVDEVKSTLAEYDESLGSVDLDSYRPTDDGASASTVTDD
jgi:hypothetical protein